MIIFLVLAVRIKISWSRRIENNDSIMWFIKLRQLQSGSVLPITTVKIDLINVGLAASHLANQCLVCLHDLAFNAFLIPMQWAWLASSFLLIQLAESSSETSLNLSTITVGIWNQSSVSEIGVNWSELGLNEKIKSPIHPRPDEGDVAGSCETKVARFQR